MLKRFGIENIGELSPGFCAEVNRQIQRGVEDMDERSNVDKERRLNMSIILTPETNSENPNAIILDGVGVRFECASIVLPKMSSKVHRTKPKHDNTLAFDFDVPDATEPTLIDEANRRKQERGE